jgi:hypothetical protein
MSSCPMSILLGPFRIFTKIRGDFRNFVFTGVNDTGDILSPVSLTAVIKLYFRIFPRIFVKVRNNPHGILSGPGEIAS